MPSTAEQAAEYERRNKNCPRHRLSIMYSNQLVSCRRRKRPLPSYSREEFIDRYKADGHFLRLLKDWKNSEYTHGLIPSFDRIDDTLSYSFDNIRLVTWEENEKDAARKKREALLHVGFPHRGVRMLSISGKIIKEFISMQAAARYTNSSQGNISYAAHGKRHTAGGYRWELIDNE